MPAFPERHARRRPIDPIPRWEPPAWWRQAVRDTALFGAVVFAGLVVTQVACAAVARWWVG